ncbi:MAG: CsgG/HfaB family protein [Kiritimatiellae bacterium]|nr:CsgG/HfaB family protein [Kiritimatiellia bacterium]
MELKRAGATKAAGALAAALLQDNAQDRLARSVADYVARGQRQEERDELRKLISMVEARGKAAGTSSDDARPRVLACLGPAVSAGAHPEAEGEALLYRILLRSGMEEGTGIRIIEREQIETLLQEQNLGVSDLADPRARLAIGKLLPASLLLLGDLLPTAQGDKLFLRLVDTETTQVLASFSAARKENELYEDVCAELAVRIVGKIVELRPLQAQVTAVDGAVVKVGLGRFHGVREGHFFDLVHRAALDKKTPEDYKDEFKGTAKVSAVSDFSCELAAVWDKDQPQRAQNLWVREKKRGSVAPNQKGQGE